MTEQKPFTFDRVVRILLSVGILAGLIWLTGYLSDVLIPFAVALLLAYLTNPLVSLIQKKNFQPCGRGFYQPAVNHCPGCSPGLVYHPHDCRRDRPDGTHCDGSGQ